VLDAEAQAVPNLRTALRTDQPPIAADSLGEMAEKLGVPVAAFASTIADFNRACGEGTYDPTRVDGLATKGSNLRSRTGHVLS